MNSESGKDDQTGPSGRVEMVEVKTFSDAATAELAKANLEARGIDCQLTADDCGGMYPNLTAAGGVRLFVRESDAGTAIALLNTQASSAEMDQIETSAVASAPPKSAAPGKLALGQIVSGMIVGVLLCLLYQWADNYGTKTYPYDWNGDGKPDEVWIYRNGVCVEVSYDRNFDGKLDNWYYYASDGRHLFTKSDDNFDGVPDGTGNYTNGIIAWAEFDRDFNGISDVTYTYAHELPKQADWRPNGTNIVTMRQIFRHGVFAEESRDINADGLFDVTVYYDAFENPIATNTFKFALPVYNR